MFRNHKFAFAAFSLLLVAVIWSFLGTLDYVTVAQGVVTPSNKIKKIQHLEGGIIRSILVKEGQRVTAGAPLIELQGTKSEAEFNELEARLATLRIDRTRLEAELQGAAPPRYSGEVANQHSKKVQKALELFKVRKSSLLNRVSVQRNVVEQKIQEMEEIQQRIKKHKKYIKILKEKIEISSNLMKDDLTNRLEHLKYLEQEVGIEGKISEDFWSLEKSKTVIKEAELRIESLKNAQKQAVLAEYSEKNNSYEELQFRRKKLLDNRSRTMIRSPVNGRIKYLYFSTVGGVVSPGAMVLEVVPETGGLLIEAKLPVNEKAYIRVGQDVKVRLTAPGPAGFGQLSGRVNYISADSIVERSGVSYFLVRITVEDNSVSYNGESYQLVPGESVECRILIGERRIIDYFVEPFWKVANLALRER